MGFKIIDAIKENISPMKRAVKKWYKKDGNNTYRLDYDLNKDSFVMDLGGYRGDFTASIVDKFNCKVMCFEPVVEFADGIKDRFKNNENVKVFTCGLEKANHTEEIMMHADGSSSYKNYKDSKKIIVEYVDVKQFFDEHDIEFVDLMKINIEGGEYDLLERMLETGLISRVNNIQIQFHYISRIDSSSRMKRICKKLSETHKITWKFRPYVWENWQLK